MQERFYKSGNCVQKNCASLGVHPKMDRTLEMRQLGWAHFAGKGLQSETEAIHAEVSADGR